MRGPLKRLEMNRAMSHTQDPTQMNKLLVLQRRELFRKSPPPGTDVKFCYENLAYFYNSGFDISKEKPV